LRISWPLEAKCSEAVCAPNDWAGWVSQRHAPGSHAPGRTGPGRDADRDAVLQRPRRAGPCCDFRTIRLRQIAEDHTIGNLVADAGLLALVLERHLDGKPDCPADTRLRDSRTGDRNLLRSDRLSPVAEDRPHFYVQTLGTAYADASGSWPS
jgi:hypothetical protein